MVVYNFVGALSHSTWPLRCRWAMSSLTHKGKPSEQTPNAPASSSASLTPTVSSASSGKHLNAHSFPQICSISL
ncbi:hypothetical protein RJ639_009959 [Escallonia herrerae]|uniref:Uncharacterized protein n=1 Tax=Escallonia herrerae TaxID=1293975 RepID=A0AA88VVU2_9ASTE|nr:hypothetical protein RJ639_009959 [Escallonia herrerae]